MKRIIEVDFPDDFRFPDFFSPFNKICDDCPFSVIDDHEREICFLTTPVSTYDQRFYDCSGMCPFKNVDEKVCLSQTRKRKTDES